MFKFFRVKTLLVTAEKIEKVMDADLRLVMMGKAQDVHKNNYI